MNNYEQMKNQFLVELTSQLPCISAKEIEKISLALDISAHGYEIEKKEKL